MVLGPLRRIIEGSYFLATVSRDSDSNIHIAHPDSKTFSVGKGGSCDLCFLSIQQYVP